MEEEKQEEEITSGDLSSFILRLILLFLLIQISPLNPWFIAAWYVILCLAVGAIEAEDEEEFL